jgi:hypothetical protein
MYGTFPLKYTYRVVKEFDGPNDGLVGQDSFAWGDDYQLLTPKGSRGISHGDIIDMNRENLPGFCVKEMNRDNLYPALINSALEELGAKTLGIEEDYLTHGEFLYYKEREEREVQL